MVSWQQYIANNYVAYWILLNRPTGGVDPLQAAQDAAEVEEEGKLSITSIDTNTLATRYTAWK